MIDPELDEIDLGYATALAERASRYMALHGVSPTPTNFAIWFNYSRGVSPDLTRAIDLRIADEMGFDPAFSRELYTRYLAPDTEAFGDIPGRLKSVMTEGKRFLTEAIADNRTQIRAIGDVAEQADTGINPKSLVQCLMEELAKAATRASKLEMNLSETSCELESIRESLNSAEERANTDALTGLPNRRALDEFLSASQIAATESGEPLSVMLIDIDNFKRFNDEFGHRVGDQVLRLAASVFKRLVREKDLPARFGGEELMAVLPGAELAVSEAVAERIRRSISECRITRRSTGELLPSITVSVGIAQFRPGESTARLIERCDRALYLAKGTGRNRVVTEGSLEGRSVA